MNDEPLTIIQPDDAATALDSHAPFIDPAVAAAADEVADQQVFKEYREGLRPATRRRQDAELRLFLRYLVEVGAVAAPFDGDEWWATDEGQDWLAQTAATLTRSPALWRNIGRGLVRAYQQWLLKQGYAVGTVNVRLAVIRKYVRLAASVGEVSEDTAAQVGQVKGLQQTRAETVDAARQATGVPTRVSGEKESANVLGPRRLALLKAQPTNSPQGRRDRLLICLLADLGLRIGEAMRLTRQDFDLEAGTVLVYRPKTRSSNRLELKEDSYEAARAYLDADAPDSDVIWRRSYKNGYLGPQGWSVQMATYRIKVLGKRISLSNLSPHDLRHTWATLAARAGTALDDLMHAGGWSSYEMPLKRYIEPARIANQNVKLQ